MPLARILLYEYDSVGVYDCEKSRFMDSANGPVRLGRREDG